MIHLIFVLVPITQFSFQLYDQLTLTGNEPIQYLEHTKLVILKKSDLPNLDIWPSQLF